MKRYGGEKIRGKGGREGMEEVDLEGRRREGKMREM